MSDIRTYTFYESGVIPGVPRDQGGEGHAGLQIDVDMAIMAAISSRLIAPPTTPILIEDNDMPRQLSVRVQSPDGAELETHTMTVYTPEDNISIPAPTPEIQASETQSAQSDFTTQPLVDLAPSEQPASPQGEISTSQEGSNA